MKFLVDANLPPALVQWLAADGDEATYVDDILKSPATDEAIWELAKQLQLIIITKDADFATRAGRDSGARVVWVRCGNLKLQVFNAWFAARAEAMRRLLLMDESVVELR